MLAAECKSVSTASKLLSASGSAVASPRRSADDPTAPPSHSQPRRQAARRSDRFQQSTRADGKRRLNEEPTVAYHWSSTTGGGPQPETTTRKVQSARGINRRVDSPHGRVRTYAQRVPAARQLDAYLRGAPLQPDVERVVSADATNTPFDSPCHASASHLAKS